MIDPDAAPTGVARTVQEVRWHRPLLVLATTTSGLAAVALVARLIDHRMLLGVNVWDKPLKFAISTTIYAVTWSWLLGQVDRGRRLGAVAGHVMVAMFAIELSVITGAAAAGMTSHFNVSTTLSSALWSVMATSISILWVADLAACVVLFRNPFGDRARTLAIRSGALIALVGLALAYLMTVPTAAQLADFHGIAGAHTVGVADGGPGLPILGWSTIAGDLRIPHFVGMHALQVVPLALIAVELGSRRSAVLREPRVRAGLVRVAASAYLAVVALVTWQALRGQSIAHPDVLTLAAGAAIAAGALAALVGVLGAGRRHQTRHPRVSDVPHGALPATSDPWVRVRR